MKNLSLIRSACMLAVLLGGASASAQVAVIVNTKSPLASMTAEQVSAIFLGKSNTLPSGATAEPADLPESVATRELFYTKVTAKSAAQIKAAWSRLVFSGKATPPEELPTSTDVKKFVAANANAIGYIEKSAVDATVKVVFSAD